MSRSKRADGGGRAASVPGASDSLARRALVLFLGAYVLLSAAELVRILLYDRPADYEVGLYPPEVVRTDGTAKLFSWTRGAGATFVRTPHGKVLRIPLYVSRPDVAGRGLELEVRIDGEVRDTIRFFRNGWVHLDYFLPALLGWDPWGGEPLGLAPPRAQTHAVFRSPTFTRPQYQPLPDYQRVFQGWTEHIGPEPVRLELVVNRTFIPAEIVRGAVKGDLPAEARRQLDWRELGIAIGEMEWLSAVPDSGVGLYSWEGDGDSAFAWTSARASISVPAAEGQGVLEVTFRPAPSTSNSARVVSFFWNEHHVYSRTVGSAQEWMRVELDVPEGEARVSSGVLTVDVSETWNPARAGASVDDRELGVALRRPRWIR